MTVQYGSRTSGIKAYPVWYGSCKQKSDKVAHPIAALWLKQKSDKVAHPIAALWLKCSALPLLSSCLMMELSIPQLKKERRPEHVYSVLEKGIFVPTEVGAFGRLHKVTSNVSEHSIHAQ